MPGTNVTPDQLKKSAEAALKRYLHKTLAFWPELPTSKFAGCAWKNPEIEWYERGKAAGYAYPNSCRLRLSLPLALQLPDALIKDTLPHELAHLIAPRLHRHRIKPHGPEWQSVCQVLTGRVLACTHRLDTSGLAARRTRYVLFIDPTDGTEHWISLRRVKNASRLQQFRSKRTGAVLFFSGQEKYM